MVLLLLLVVVTAFGVIMYCSALCWATAMEATTSLMVGARLAAKSTSPTAMGRFTDNEINNFSGHNQCCGKYNSKNRLGPSP